MANYINIGNTCANFDYDTGNIPTTSLTGLYLINGSSGMPLKDTPVPTASQTTGFLAVTSYPGGSNSFNIADNEFKVWYSEGLSRFASNRQDWRYLTDLAASAPVYNDAAETGSLQYQTVVTSGGSAWPTQTTINGGAAFSAGFQVTHPAVGGSTYYLVNSSNVLMYTYANTNIVTLPTPISYTTPSASTTISMDNTPVFYLYNKTSDKRYITYSGTAFGVTDTNLVTATAPTAFYMTRVRNGTRIFVALATGTPGSGTVVAPTSDGVAVLSNFEVQITSTTAGVAGTYRITTINPPIGEDPAGFPDTTATLLKHVATGKYLYWTGTGINTSITSPGIFELKDFWTSGLSANQIVQGMQFRFQDMTVTSNAAAAGSGTILDWYHWKVVADVTKSPLTTHNTSNVAVTRFGSNTWVLGSPSGQFFGNQSSSTDTNPSKFEGWTITGTSGASSNALVYVRVPQSGGVPTPVGYLTVSGSSPAFVQSSTLPNLTIGAAQNANSWVCYKCTFASGQYCSPYSTGSSSVTPKLLATSLTIAVLTSTSIRVTVNGSGLVGGEQIAFRVAFGSNMSGAIQTLSAPPTSYVAGGVFTLNFASGLTATQGYTVELTSAAALVSGSPVTQQFTMTKSLGSISAVPYGNNGFKITFAGSSMQNGDNISFAFTSSPSVTSTVTTGQTQSWSTGTNTYYIYTNISPLLAASTYTVTSTTTDVNVPSKPITAPGINGPTLLFNNRILQGRWYRNGSNMIRFTSSTIVEVNYAPNDGMMPSFNFTYDSVNNRVIINYVDAYSSAYSFSETINFISTAVTLTSSQGTFTLD